MGVCKSERDRQKQRRYRGKERRFVSIRYLTSLLKKMFFFQTLYVDVGGSRSTQRPSFLIQFLFILFVLFQSTNEIYLFIWNFGIIKKSRQKPLVCSQRYPAKVFFKIGFMIILQCFLSIIPPFFHICTEFQPPFSNLYFLHSFFLSPLLLWSI